MIIALAALAIAAVAFWIGRATASARRDRSASSPERSDLLERQLEACRRDLEEAQERAEQALRVENQFLASMSHELRTPLNAIIGFAQMLEHEYFGSLAEKQHEYVEDIQKSARHLLSVISAILDLSKITSGSATTVTQKFDLAEICRSVIAVSTPLARQNGNALTLDLGPAPAEIESDATKLRQCLLNLLGNACKFTENGRVSLIVHGIERDGASWVSFAVTDTGIGIAEESRDRMFRVFSQADAMISERFGGSGLGLALTAQFASLLGGQVTYESRLGVGSTFTLLLPAVPAPNETAVRTKLEKPLPIPTDRMSTTASH